MKSDLPQARGWDRLLEDPLPRLKHSGGHLLVSTSEQMVSVLLGQIFKCGIWAILQFMGYHQWERFGVANFLWANPFFPCQYPRVLVSLLSNSPMLDAVRASGVAGNALSAPRVVLKGLAALESSVGASGIQTRERNLKVFAFIFSQPYSSHDGFGKGTNQRCCPLLEKWVFIGILAITYVQDWTCSCCHSLAGWQLADEWISQDHAKGYGLYFLGEIASNTERGERRWKWWHWCSSKEEGTN